MIAGNVILILAGDPRPLEDGGCVRQLVPIGGKPLLLRTWEQVEPYGYLTFVVTPHAPTHEIIPHCFIPDRSDIAPHTLLSARSVYGDRTFVLMGDTLYSGEATQVILSDTTNDLMCYGDHGELGAIVFSKDRIDTVTETLVACGADRPWTWVFYRLLCGFGIREHKFDDKLYYKLSKEQRIRDFDSIRMYKKFLEDNPWAR